MESWQASAELQITQLYQPLISQQALLVTIIPVQQQSPGSNNCGLFSIAAAYHAAKGNNIETITLNENKMRSHLIRCFEKQKLTAFPKGKQTGEVRRPKWQYIAIPVYCPCQRPDSLDQMIQCDKCKTWNHFQCAKIKEAPLGDWFCTMCT